MSTLKSEKPNLWKRRYESCRMGMLIMAATIGCLLIGLLAVLLWR